MLRRCTDVASWTANVHSWPLYDYQLCIRLRVTICLTDDEIDRYPISHVVVERHNFFRRERLVLQSLHLPSFFVLREASTTAVGVSIEKLGQKR